MAPPGRQSRPRVECPAGKTLLLPRSPLLCSALPTSPVPHFRLSAATIASTCLLPSRQQPAARLAWPSSPFLGPTFLVLADLSSLCSARPIRPRHKSWPGTPPPLQPSPSLLPPSLPLPSLLLPLCLSLPSALCPPSSALSLSLSLSVVHRQLWLPDVTPLPAAHRNAARPPATPASKSSPPPPVAHTTVPFPAPPASRNGIPMAMAAELAPWDLQGPPKKKEAKRRGTEHRKTRRGPRGRELESTAAAGRQAQNGRLASPSYVIWHRHLSATQHRTPRTSDASPRPTARAAAMARGKRSPARLSPPRALGRPSCYYRPITESHHSRMGAALL